MQLLPCAPPVGPLERAPMTALRPEGEGEWVGFWAGDHAYYARHTREDGGAEWFEVRAEEGGTGPRPVRPATPRSVGVLPPRRALSAVGRLGPNASFALVWSSRRRRA